MVFYVLVCDLESCVTVRVKGAVHDGGFPLFTGLSEVYTIRAGVGYHLPSRRPRGVSEEGVWL